MEKAEDKNKESEDERKVKQERDEDVYLVPAHFISKI